MSGLKIKLIKKTDNLLETTKLYINLVLLYKGLKCSEGDIQILTHLMMNGYNKMTVQSVIDMKLVKNMNCMRNILTKFRKIGLIVREGYSERLCDEMNFSLDKKLNLINFLIDNN